MSETILRCRFCETLFEPDVADGARCPQCGIDDSEPVEASKDDFVVCTSTKFR